MMQRLGLCLVLLAAGIATATTVQSAEPIPHVILGFDQPGELPEGIVAAADGSLYFTLAPRGQVLRLPRRDARRWGPPRVVATLPPPLPNAPGALGLTLDDAGNVYCAYAAFNENRGVWLVTALGWAFRLPQSENIVFPNALAFDESGNLFVTDTAAGAVWRIPPGGGAGAAPWITHPTLQGTGVLGNPFPLGANGLAWDECHRSLVVANTEQGLLVRIPVLAGGGPGEPQVLRDDLFTVDGVAVDSRGSIYAAIAGLNEVVRVSADGSLVETLHSGAPLHLPASLAFGRAALDRHTLFITNFAFDPSLGSTGPALIYYRVARH